MTTRAKTYAEGDVVLAFSDQWYEVIRVEKVNKDLPALNRYTVRELHPFGEASSKETSNYPHYLIAGRLPRRKESS